MYKLLIYMSEDDIKPVGGPKGYIWNLSQEIENHSEEDICISFIPAGSGKKNVLKQYLISIYEQVTKRTPYIRAVYKIVSKKRKYAKINLSWYDSVHFHSTYELYMAKDSLEDYSGKVILTSHSPKVLHREYIEDYITEAERKKFHTVLEKIDVMDEYAFNRADAIVFPCVEAEEPYYHSWEKFASIYEKSKNKYYYVPTGIKGKIVKEDSVTIRKKYGIPYDAFVVSFVGRHNEVKGYEFLKEIANQVFKDYSNVYFLIAGNEGPLKRLEHKQWIECGWLDDTASVIASSDVFFLPNKETYFDLIMLEVLSVGTPIICTNTGGNKFFKQFESSGIEYVEYGDVKNACAILKKISTYNKETTNLMKNDNQRLFEDNFTTQKFFSNYIKVINDILSKE